MSDDLWLFGVMIGAGALALAVMVGVAWWVEARARRLDEEERAARALLKAWRKERGE